MGIGVRVDWIGGLGNDTGEASRRVRDDFLEGKEKEELTGEGCRAEPHRRMLMARDEARSIGRASAGWRIFVCLFVCLFVFGCIGSSLRCAGFLQLRRAGATLQCGARASHRSGFSHYGAQALGAWVQ